MAGLTVDAMKALTADFVKREEENNRIALERSFDDMRKIISRLNKRGMTEHANKIGDAMNAMNLLPLRGKGSL